MSCIGIDIGASFVKGAILDHAKNRVINVGKVGFPIFDSPKNIGQTSVEIGKVVDSFLTILRESIRQTNGKEHHLYISCQMHSLVLSDERGNGLSPFISWQDRRSCIKVNHDKPSVFEELKEKVGKSLIKSTGNEINFPRPLYTLKWLKVNNLFPIKKFYACSLSDFIVSHLTASSPKTDKTLAAASGIYDIHENSWNDQLIEFIDADNLFLPEVKEQFVQIGSFDYEGKKIIIYNPIGDQQAAMIGIGLTEHQLSINVGTGAQVSILSKFSEVKKFHVRPFVDDWKLNTIVHIPSGRSLDLIVGLFNKYANKSIDEIWNYILSDIEDLYNLDLSIDLSFFPCAFGERGSITNINEENLTPGKIMLASLNCLTDYYYKAFECLNPQRIDSIYLSGGIPKRIPLLKSLIEKRFDMTVTSYDGVEDTLLGLYKIAGLNQNFFNNYQDANIGELEVTEN